MKSCSGKPCNDNGDCSYCNIADGTDIIKDCDHCKTGKKQLDAYNSWKKEKKIPYYKLLLILKDCGGRCVSCQYNNIKGRKAKAYSKIPRLNFQQLDMFEAIEEGEKK